MTTGFVSFYVFVLAIGFNDVSFHFEISVKLGDIILHKDVIIIGLNV